MAETNETCFGNMITKSAWLCHQMQLRSLVETSAHDKVDTGTFGSAQRFYTCKLSAAGADDGRTKLTLAFG